MRSSPSTEVLGYCHSSRFAGLYSDFFVQNLPPTKTPVRGFYLNVLNEARSSETKNSGCSQAAKCVPLGSRL
jgi:hypothetical protein